MFTDRYGQKCRKKSVDPGLESNIVAKRKAIIKATNENPNKDVVAIFDEILLAYNIHFHKYHGKTLTGGNCARFIDRIAFIVADMKVKLQEVIDIKYNYNKALRVEMTRRLESLLSHISILCYVFNQICRYLYRTTLQTDESLDTFEKLCCLFGNLWRKCGLNVTPKIHIIESHLNDFMRRFGRLGILTDDTMERTWIEDHKWEHTYSCVLNWQTRTELKFARLQAEMDPEVQDAAAKGKTSAKRSKDKAAAPAASLKTYTDVYEFILTLEDKYPFRSILGNSKDREEVDLIYDDIDDEVEKDIDHAARNL